MSIRTIIIDIPEKKDGKDKQHRKETDMKTGSFLYNPEEASALPTTY